MRPEMSRNVPVIVPPWTILIVPACSTTYSVSGSPGAEVTKTGESKPVATGVNEKLLADWTLAAPLAAMHAARTSERATDQPARFIVVHLTRTGGRLTEPVQRAIEGQRVQLAVPVGPE